MTDFKLGEITEKIIGASFRVQSTLGNGFQEVIYQRAMQLEMPFENLIFKREMEMPVYYRDQIIGTRRVDFFVEEIVMVELKAIIKLSGGFAITIWQFIRGNIWLVDTIIVWAIQVAQTGFLIFRNELYQT